MSSISFPNMFDNNKHNVSVRPSFSIKGINESLTTLFKCNINELLGDPNYGTDFVASLLDLKTRSNVYLIKRAIIYRINKYLPYLIVSEESINIYNNPNNNKYKINILYKLKNVDQTYTFSFVT